MVDLSVCGAAEYAHARPLPATFFFHEKIPVKSVVVAGQEPDLVPAAAAGPLPERSEFDFGNQREIDFITHVRGYRGIPIGPHIAHGTGELIVRGPHHVIDDEAVFSGSEELGEADVPEVRWRFITNVGRPLAENVVGLNERSHGQLSAKNRHAFPLVLERDLGFQELVAQLAILVALAFEFHAPSAPSSGGNGSRDESN